MSPVVAYLMKTLNFMIFKKYCYYISASFKAFILRQYFINDYSKYLEILLKTKNNTFYIILQ